MLAKVAILHECGRPMTSRIVDDDVGMWLSAVFVQMCMLKAKRSYTIITHDASLTSITAAPPPPCGAILFRKPSALHTQ